MNNTYSMMCDIIRFEGFSYQTPSDVENVSWIFRTPHWISVNCPDWIKEIKFYVYFNLEI
jgi:hypothetical protein